MQCALWELCKSFSLSSPLDRSLATLLFVQEGNLFAVRLKYALWLPGGQTRLLLTYPDFPSRARLRCAAAGVAEMLSWVQTISLRCW